MAALDFRAIFYSWIFVFSILHSIARASPHHAKGHCRHPIIRKEWRTLNSVEKLNYIIAVKCLQALPAKSTKSTPGAVTRYDDFQGVHIRNADYIHFVGHCHPWHRYFLALFEKALKEECGYSGALPYWDWTLDTQSEEDFLSSPVFDSNTGFGGNGPWIANSTNPELVAPGRTGGGCVADGPFKTLEVHLGPRRNIMRNNQCLTRDFTPWVATTYLTSAAVTEAIEQADFGWFDKLSQGGIVVEDYKYHVGGHLAVGGELGTGADVWASPGDPLFYLHHGNMDRLWWKWQSQDLPQRLSDISGPITPFAFPFGNVNSTVGNVTLGFELGVNELGPTISIADVMNIRGGVLCYDYK